MIFSFVLQFALAAPFPVTSSSYFLNNKINAFLWPYNLELDLQNTPYEIDLTRGDRDKWSIKNPSSTIQVFLRVRKLGPKEDYDKSLKNSIREYEKGGYQIVSQQIGQKSPEKGWIHLQDTSEKQMVQNFIYKDRIWAYMNCVGSKAQLKELKETCESLSSKLKIKTN